MATVGMAALLAAAGYGRAGPPQTFTHDVAFKVGENSSIIWFEIDNPSIGGTLNVTNQPYPSADSLNAAVVDISRDRLIYSDDTNGANVQAYSISLSGIQLVQNGTTAVTTTPIGQWPGGNDNAGYSKTNNNVYYHVYGSDELRFLNFNTSGGIVGYTSVGDFNGPGFTTKSITAGDMDFDSSGTIWVSGTNDTPSPRLWIFNTTTLTVMDSVQPYHTYQGIVFDSTGTTLYGYTDATGNYGTINPANGYFGTVLATNSAMFGDSGDLAEATEAIVPVQVPEPGGVGIIGSVVMCAMARIKSVRDRNPPRDLKLRPAGGR